MLVLVGVFFMLQNLGYGLFSWANFWPVLIIGAGVAMIWGRFDRPQRMPYAANERSDNLVQAFAIFGGIERRVHTNNFKGGQLTAMFGGVEMDFRSADIEGEEASIYVDAVFGGIELVVPDRWTVVWEGQNIFGGYSDETRAPLPDVAGAAPRKRLILQGHAVFGGVAVKN
jgi:predicted membrane protein